MSTPLSAADPKRPFIHHSAKIRLEEELQSKRIKEVILPILAVLGGFFLFSLESAILFTAIVIFGVFICGNGRVSASLSPARLPFSSPPNIDDPSYNPWRGIPSPAKPSGKKTPQLHPATPVSGTPTFRPTPGTIRGVAHWLGLSDDAVLPLAESVAVSPQTFARKVSQMKHPRFAEDDPSLEIKQPRTPGKEEKASRRNMRNVALVTPRNLAADFGSSSHLPSVPEDTAG
jgi:hypothetical protein